MGITAGGLGLLLGSHWMRRRLRRYAKYQAIAGKKPTVTISQLATAADVSPRRVENDLEQMVQKGFWGKEAYLDLGRGVLVRTFEAAEDLEQAQKEAQPSRRRPGRATAANSGTSAMPMTALQTPLSAPKLTGWRTWPARYSALWRRSRRRSPRRLPS